MSYGPRQRQRAGSQFVFARSYFLHVIVRAARLPARRSVEPRAHRPQRFRPANMKDERRYGRRRRVPVAPDYERATLNVWPYADERWWVLGLAAGFAVVLVGI